MNEQIEIKEYIKKINVAMCDAFNSIGHDKYYSQDKLEIEHLFHYDGDFEEVRIYKVTDDEGDYGIATTRWWGKDLTDIVWMFDGNTDVLWSTNNQYALYHHNNQPKSNDTLEEQSDDIITEDENGKEITPKNHKEMLRGG